MKTPQPKTLLAIGIVIGIVLIAIWYIPISSGADGAPAAIITVQLKDVTTGNTYEAEIDSQPLTTAEIAGGRKSIFTATTVQADVPALNPVGTYLIDFSAGITIDAVADIRVEIAGVLGDGGTATTDSKMDNEEMVDYIAEAPIGKTTLPFASSDPFAYSFDGAAYTVIKGVDVDGSTFTIDVESKGYNAEGAWSTGTAQITAVINVGAEGTITITVNDIIVDVV